MKYRVRVVGFEKQDDRTGVHENRIRYNPFQSPFANYFSPLSTHIINRLPTTT